MESELLQSVFSKISAFSTIPVYWPNVSGDIPSGEHLRIHVMNTAPQTLTTCSGKSRHQWIIQLSVYFKEGVGPIKPAQLIDDVRNEFSFNTKVVSNNYTFQTISQAEVLLPKLVDGWYFQPIRIRFICFN